MKQHIMIRKLDNSKTNLSAADGSIFFCLEILINQIFSLDLNHTFEDQLEVLMERLKESQTIGKHFLLIN